MADKEELVQRLRAAWPAGVATSEVKMFGGIAFLHQGNMVAAASSRGLLFRVGAAQEADILARPGASVMEMRGRPVPGYIRIIPAEATDALIAGILPAALAYVGTLPPKAAATQAKRAKPKTRAS